jgi:hypothetical protein
MQFQKKQDKVMNSHTLEEVYPHLKHAKSTPVQDGDFTVTTITITDQRNSSVHNAFMVEKDDVAFLCTSVKEGAQLVEESLNFLETQGAVGQEMAEGIHMSRSFEVLFQTLSNSAAYPEPALPEPKFSTR